MAQELDTAERGVELVQLARLRRGCYRLFAALFLYPQRDRLNALVLAAEEFEKNEREGLTAFAFWIPWRRLSSALCGLAGGDPSDVEGRYFELFESRPGNARCRPYESSYVDPHGKSGGRIAAQLRREYALAGVKLSESTRELPDHIAVELEFLAFLCGREAKAWEDEALEDGILALKRARAFLREHISRWLPRFATEVSAADEGGAYALGAKAVNAFVHYDQDVLDLLLERFQSSEPPGVAERSCCHSGAPLSEVRT